VDFFGIICVNLRPSVVELLGWQLVLLARDQKINLLLSWDYDEKGAGQ
jgi:hypothetical protein